MEVVGIIVTIIIGLIAGGFIGASLSHITGYRKEYEKQSFGEVFRKMIQPIIFFLLVYGTTYLIRGESGLILGAVVGIPALVINYRASLRQIHAKYMHYGKVDERGERHTTSTTVKEVIKRDKVSVTNPATTSNSVSKPLSKNTGLLTSYVNRLVDTAISSEETLTSKFDCSDVQQRSLRIHLIGIGLIALQRKLSRKGVDRQTQQKVADKLMQEIAPNILSDDATMQLKIGLAPLLDSHPSGPLRNEIDDLTRHGFVVLLAKIALPDDESSARSACGIEIDKMVQIGESFSLSELRGRP